jgi:hypothetical protein
MLLDMHRAKRCGARTRSGKPCQSPAMSNGRCRMHGGPSPGAPKGNQHAYKHGRYTAEAMTNRQRLTAMLYFDEGARTHSLAIEVSGVPKPMSRLRTYCSRPYDWWIIAI